MNPKPLQKWHRGWSLNEEVIFNQVRKEVEALTPASRPLCLALDDTILRKTGKTIPGAAWRKDPLGPPFNLNLIWAQRRIQLSAAVADENNEARMIPIGFEDASTPRKPRKTAPPEQFELYKERMKQRNLNTLATRVLRQLQQDRTIENGGTTPALHVVADGSYTNKKMLRNLPANTTLIGRIRKVRQGKKKGAWAFLPVAFSMDFPTAKSRFSLARAHTRFVNGHPKEVSSRVAFAPDMRPVAYQGQILPAGVYNCCAE